MNQGALQPCSLYEALEYDLLIRSTIMSKMQLSLITIIITNINIINIPWDLKAGHHRDHNHLDLHVYHLPSTA